MAGGKVVIVACLLGEEDGNTRDEQRVRQALDDGVQQCLEVCLRTEAATEFDQRLPVVVALAIEDAVDPLLDAAPERVKKLRCDDDGGDQSPEPKAGKAIADDLPGEGDQAEVEGDERCSGQRVGDAALEDEVRIHEAVTDDGPAEGERQKDQREDRDLGQQVGNQRIGQIGNGEENRVRRNGEDCAACEPLELLAAQRLVFALIVHEEDYGGEDVVDCLIANRELVEPMLQQRCRRPQLDSDHLQSNDEAGRQVSGGDQPAANAPAFRKSQGKVQEERGLQGAGNDVAPEDDLIERVELAGVFEGVKRKRRQAENVEMGRVGRSPAPEEDIESDSKIDECYKAEALIVAAVDRVEVQRDFGK